MSIKRMSLRFNLDNEADRKAWEHLKNAADSKNKAVITVINQFYEPHVEILETIKETYSRVLAKSFCNTDGISTADRNTVRRRKRTYGFPRYVSR